MTEQSKRIIGFTHNASRLSTGAWTSLSPVGLKRLAGYADDQPRGGPAETLNSFRLAREG